MGSYISQKNFDKFEMKYLETLATRLRERHPDIPLMVFARGAQYANEGLQRAGYDVVTLDTEANRVEQVSMLENDSKNAPIGRRVTLQGNFDPKLLQEGTEESVKAAVGEMLQELGPQRLIANLGEGLSGKEDPKLVKAFVDAIHATSEEMNKKLESEAIASSA
uniref:Uroporphyrinogen decarboxylase (URO-D) domain-containing protein n=2 Tax=Amorphochlora amoebiformis TaxID=1561963 RepID=A0A7S0DD13_9EUKA|mmetsp:Transcript_24029/g.37800  ORF Transcript_24029/g.37800 Transcript_24029/m.37800 type:complete len:164 (+) Transcript_24029:160-651(+)